MHANPTLENDLGDCCSAINAGIAFGRNIERRRPMLLRELMMEITFVAVLNQIKTKKQRRRRIRHWLASEDICFYLAVPNCSMRRSIKRVPSSFRAFGLMIWCCDGRLFKETGSLFVGGLSALE
jgi:hypothetical protein